MYDVEPADGRISRANILQTGIPEQSGSVDYVFLDPPHSSTHAGDDPDFSADAAKSDTMMKSLKPILRESTRILKKGGRMSIVVEPTPGVFGIIDFPFEVTNIARELGMIAVGKAYLPRRGDAGKARSHSSGEKMKTLIST